MRGEERRGALGQAGHMLDARLLVTGWAWAGLGWAGLGLTRFPTRVRGLPASGLPTPPMRRQPTPQPHTDADAMLSGRDAELALLRRAHAEGAEGPSLREERRPALSSPLKLISISLNLHYCSKFNLKFFCAIPTVKSLEL